jgi:hypothetical protein
MRLLLLLTLLASALLPCGVSAAAQATAGLAISDDGKSAPRTTGTVVSVVAAAGERNAITVSADGSSVVVADTGAPLTAGGGCVVESASQVRCARQGPPALPLRTIVDAGDQDDVVAAVGLPATIALGSGNDRLDLGQGRAGTVDGGPGDDVLSDDEPSLARRRHDLLIGGAGDDVLYVPSGATADAGSGDDVIAAAFGSGEIRDVQLSCGRGHDLVTDVLVRLPRDCEEAGVGALGRFARPRLTGRTLRVGTRREGAACTLRLRATRGGHALSRWTSRRFRAGTTTVRTLHLTTAPEHLPDLELRPVRCADGPLGAARPPSPGRGR